MALSETAKEMLRQLEAKRMSSVGAVVAPIDPLPQVPYGRWSDKSDYDERKYWSPEMAKAAKNVVTMELAFDKVARAHKEKIEKRNVESERIAAARRNEINRICATARLEICSADEDKTLDSLKEIWSGLLVELAKV